MGAGEKTRRSAWGRLGGVLGWAALSTMGGGLSCGTAERAPVTADALARYTLIASSCQGLDFLRGTASSYGPLFERSPQLSAALRASVACFEGARRGCESMQRCMGAAVATSSPLPCESRSYCDGSTSVRCFDGPGEAFTTKRANCGALGMPCDDGRCVVPGQTGRRCESGTYRGRCELDAPLYCAGGVEYAAVRCSSAGLRCVEGSQYDGRAGAFCGGEGPACQRRVWPDGSLRWPGLGCEGSTLRVCLANEREALVDCGAWVAGASCQQALNPATGEVDFFCGVASECNPLSTLSTCEGDAVVFCNGGRVERLGCSELGLGPCRVRGAEGARCDPSAEMTGTASAPPSSTAHRDGG